MVDELTRWDPVREAMTLRDAMTKLFEDSVVWPRMYVTRDTARGSLNMLPIDMYETSDTVVIQAVLPGVKSEDVDIQFQDGRFVIEATFAEPMIENAKLHYRELNYGKYHREIVLPVDVQTDKVDATLHDGLLTLRLPKAEEIKPKKILVKPNSK